MYWDRLTRTAAPASALMTSDDIKSHVNIDWDDDDDYLDALIAAATARIDGPFGEGIPLLTQSWAISLDHLPGQYFQIPMYPVQSVDSITYVDVNGDTQTLDPSLYLVDYGRNPVVIAHAHQAQFPSVQRQLGCVKINFTCGYGDDPSDVPADILHAVRLLVGHYYLNREAVVGIGSRDTPQELPFGVGPILSNYKPITFA